MGRADRTWNPLGRDGFTVQEAADYLKLSAQEVLDKMPYKMRRGVRTPDELVYLDYPLSLSWVYVYQLKRDLERELAKKNQQPELLGILDDSKGQTIKHSRASTKALDEKTFDIPSAAKFLGISEQDLLTLRDRRKNNFIRAGADREFVYAHTRFTWEEVLTFRKKLAKQSKTNTRKPQQLLFDEPL